uniref:Uncharacterized protein n=1 Tax=Rhodosorus marinus TaxID=101924 RepID=A0A7S2ZRD3_9RHOD|mmetsp:Transcript_29838/g.114569  ORF Transcript_29838/g.114569 Transcript_29838/m.114569 type:complete len:136 (+) Transcript_29838:139-546(+)
MEGLDTEGIEFYDDTSGVPSHGFTSEVTPKAGDERRGGREILPGDDGGKREYERRMSPFGMDDSRGFQTLFDEIEKSFSGFSRRGNDPSGEMNSMFGRLFDGFFGTNGSCARKTLSIRPAVCLWMNTRFLVSRRS